ncbi:MAG TPA: TolC family protein [Pyrinomonadaceae bacterium]|nr:TolC family protein [Pyrinomonadaceae bacterium]
MFSLSSRPPGRSARQTALALAVVCALCFGHVMPARVLAATASAEEQPQTMTLTGVVKSPKGAPVTEAVVTLRRVMHEDQTTRTDTDGRFQFANIAHGPAVLIAATDAERSVLFIEVKNGLGDVEVVFDRKQSDYAVASAVGSPMVASLADVAPQQQPTPAPQLPAQRDAGQPPNRQTQPGVPPEARPRPSDPTAPPGAERPNPQSPPNRQTTSPQPAATPVTPELPVTTPQTQTNTETQVDPATGLEQIREPAFTASQPRPVPPMPSLARVGITGGETRPMSLNDAIRRALENNNEIEVARADVRIAESFLNSLRGFYEPFYQLNPQYSNFSNPSSTTLSGAGDESSNVTRTIFDFDTALVKNFETGGGRYEFFYRNSREKTNNRFATLNPLYGSSLGATFTQPLLRDRAIDATRRSIRIQRKRLEQSDADFRRRTIEIISQVQRAYWDLVFAIRDEQNQIANLNLARENFRRTEASVAAGASAPLERAEIQTELSNREAALLLASQGVTIAENNLKSLILKDPMSPDWSAAFIPTDQPTFDETPVVLQDALTEARTNRPELRRLKLEQEVNDIDLQYFRNQTKPRIDLTGTVASTGLAGTPGPLRDQNGEVVIGPDGQPLLAPLPKSQVGGVGQNIRNVLTLQGRSVVVGVTIQIPFRNKTARANLTTAQIQREQLAATTRSQEQVVEVEVRNAAQSVETARRRVLAARQARENAELQLAGERRLYQVGRSTTFLLFQRENALVNARNQELRAETDYNKALADLQRATSTTLRANNVVIDSPVRP